MAFLYYRPLSSYLADAGRARRPARAGRGAAGREGAPRAAARPHDERRCSRPRGAADRLRQARRAAVHRQGHRRLAAPASRDDTVEFSAWRIATSSSARSAGAPVRSTGSPRAAPSALPAVTEQEPVRRRGSALPDDLLPHLPSPGGGRLPARGGRRRRALERRRRGEPRADRRPRRRDGAAAAGPPRARRRAGREPITAHRSTPGSAARATRRSSSASTPTSRSRSRSRATGIGELVLAEIPEPFPTDRCCVGSRARRSVSSAVDSARRDWEDGNRRFELASRDAAQAERLRRQFDLISAELRRRVGSTFTRRDARGRVRGLGRLDPPGDRGVRADARLGAVGLDGRRRCIPRLRARSC